MATEGAIGEFEREDRLAGFLRHRHQAVIMLQLRQAVLVILEQRRRVRLIEHQMTELLRNLIHSTLILQRVDTDEALAADLVYHLLQAGTTETARLVGALGRAGTGPLHCRGRAGGVPDCWPNATARPAPGRVIVMASD